MFLKACSTESTLGSNDVYGRVYTSVSVMNRYLWPLTGTRHCLITISSKKYVLQQILVKWIFFLFGWLCVLKIKSEVIRWSVQVSGSSTINLWLGHIHSFLLEILGLHKKEVLEQSDSWVLLTIIKLGTEGGTTKQLYSNFRYLRSSEDVDIDYPIPHPFATWSWHLR